MTVQRRGFLRIAAFSAVLILSVRPAAGAEFVAPYVNMVEEDVALMLDLAELGPDDRLIDLGAGDGRIVIEAARRSIPAHGVELNPELVALARERAATAGVTELATFEVGDVFTADLSGATVVTLYLMPDANLALRPKLLRELPPGARLLSLSFTMGEWQPDARAQGRTSGGVLLWRIPAQVAGRWELVLEERSYELLITQEFQALNAGLSRKGRAVPVEAHLSGSDIRITFEEAGTVTELHGRVAGSRMLPTGHGDRSPPWQALRVPKR